MKNNYRGRGRGGRSGKGGRKKLELLLNATPYEKRVALVENGKLVELNIERPRDRGLSGNIYKGTVVRVLPGMQSAFLEVGLQRTAFIHVSDIQPPRNKDLEEDGDGSDSPDTGGTSGQGNGDSRRGASKQESRQEARIEDLIKEGQEMVVQVAKEPIGTKGARVTSYTSIPGRYLVLMPNYNKIGVSRRISSEKERRRLRTMVKELRPENHGFIIRTVCEGMTKEDVEADMDYLERLWKVIQRREKRSKAPSMLYEEFDLTLRTVRDTFSKDITRLVIDSPKEYDRTVKFAEEFLPKLRDRIELYEGDDGLFDSYGVDMELQDALDPKVWLRSGGSLVMDQMEALTAIDVNTGKFVGKKNSEETIVKTNLEAVKEIVYQLRLRNIGGIIVIDFIDMASAENREKVYNALRDELRKDKTRTNVLKISDLGIVEMTRKRTRESLSQSLCEPCPYCDGNGLVKSKDMMIMEVYRDLIRDLTKSRKKTLTLYVNPGVAERLTSETSLVGDLEKSFGKKVDVKPVDLFHQEQYEIV